MWILSRGLLAAVVWNQAQKQPGAKSHQPFVVTEVQLLNIPEHAPADQVHCVEPAQNDCVDAKKQLRDMNKVPIQPKMETPLCTDR